jgi:hypothetical protein
LNTHDIHTNKYYKLGQYKSAISLPLQATQWPFFALCCYLLSQAYTIPILPIGPWAVWPCLSDLAAGLFVLTFLLNFRQAPLASSANRRIFLLLVLVLWSSILSYTWYLTWVDPAAKGVNFGIFQIYRLVQFISIFWVTTRIPFTLERINILRRIVDTVFIFVCLGIWLTYTSIVPLAAVTAHLPQVGAWMYYEGAGEYESLGLGFVGYNHAYGAVQVLMLASLRIHLALNQDKVLSNTAFLLISIATCFVSGSRAGFAAMLFFAIVYTYRFKKIICGFILIYVMLILMLVTLIVLQLYPVNVNTFGDSNITIRRQQALLEINDPSSFNGRDEIWAERITFLKNQDIVSLLFGTGFGSAIDSGNNAHMLYLQIILETGLVGLLLFILLFWQIIYFLNLYESGFIKSIFWATISFLISSLTQETFYPVPALGHFLGFYLCSLAIALRK